MIAHYNPSVFKEGNFLSISFPFHLPGMYKKQED